MGGGTGGRKHWLSGSESWSGGWLGGYCDVYAGDDGARWRLLAVGMEEAEIELTGLRCWVAVAAAVVGEEGIRKKEQSWETPRFLAWVGVIM